MLEKEQKTSRRKFLQKLTVIGTAGVVTPVVLSACGGGGGEQAGAGDANGETAAGNGGFSCTDTTGLTEQEIQMRENAEYVDATPNPEQYCANCQLYEEPAGGVQCGGCQVIAGPIHPEGYCTLWVAQQV